MDLKYIRNDNQHRNITLPFVENSFHTHCMYVKEGYFDEKDGVVIEH